MGQFNYFYDGYLSMNSRAYYKTQVFRISIQKWPEIKSLYWLRHTNDWTNSWSIFTTKLYLVR